LPISHLLEKQDHVHCPKGFVYKKRQENGNR
jgi:hypothetical protein